MLLNGVRYCDCCGIKLNRNNNKCGYEICDRCNEQLENRVRGDKNSAALKVLNTMLMAVETKSNIPIGYGEDVERTLLTAKGAIADSNFLNFLVNVIPPNDMEKYREMYNCTNDKNNC